MIDLVFLTCAVVGSVVFLIWLVLQFVGADLDLDADADGVDFGAGEASGEADASFTLLSFQGLSAFFTIFGFVGLSSHREAQLSPFVALAIAMAAGLAMSFVVNRLFRMFTSLQSSGTIDMRSAVGQDGSVYLTIPEGGEGKVQLTIQGRFRVVPAVADSRERLETGRRIKVVRVDDGHTMVVEPLT